MAKLTGVYPNPANAEGRPEFDKAWEMLQEPVRKALEASDAAATVITCLRLAAHIHMQASKKLGRSFTDTHKGFHFICARCFDQQFDSWSQAPAAEPKMTQEEANALCILFRSLGVTAQLDTDDNWCVWDGENERLFRTVGEAVAQLQDEYNG